MCKKGEKEKGRPELTKAPSLDSSLDLAMEEGHRAAPEMPNLPKPLTLEEKKYLLAVERGDINTTRKMMQKAHRHRDFMNMNCTDPLGRGSLHMAISNENLEMVELLVVMGVETKDALLHAIDAEFVEAVEVLLEHEEVVHKDGEEYSWEKADRNTSSFTGEITPLILAAHKDNYEILKILLDRGALIPMPHDIRCGCQECIKSSKEDSLRHSRSRINAYRALASPSLIALTSTDPILTAFQLSIELKNLAYTEHEFRADYLELRKKCMNFAEELLGHARSSTELAVMLNHDPDSVVPYVDGEHMSLKRLELAIECKQKRFVAHPNIQQLLASMWYEGVPGFRRKSVIEKCLEIIKVVVLFPFYCLWYMLLPDSATGRLIRTPFMKFVIHSASYLFFLLMLILVSVRFENLVIWLFGSNRMRQALEEAMRRQRGNLPTPIECAVALWVIGFLWEEIKEIRVDGLRKYLSNMWNLLDVMRDTLYVSTGILRVIAYIQQTSEISREASTAFIPREQWDAFDPQLISEGLFAAANILSALKLVHIFSINPYLGPLQISLGRMVIDIVKFFFIYSLVLFAFACGLTQLLWYFNDLEKAKCYSLPGGLPDWTKQSDACMKWRRFHNLFEASQSLFWASFGMVGLEDFELTGIQEYTRFWSMLMFGAYSVINVIVLLNLLIAMMSSSYSFIVEHADTEWKFARAKLWMSYFEAGSTLPPPFNILPTIKGFLRLCGKQSKKQQLIRNISIRTQNRRRRTLDYHYLAVMRALIWRYVRSLQRRNEERPVNEDDISEVKGDISSLRFELIDLFSHNGMDVSMCAKKSRAALGRKMRVWERRLMRDFYVSPAMGSEDSINHTKEAEEPQEEEPTSARDRFRKVAFLALAAANPERRASCLSQIGSGDNHGRESLKVAMERARRKMAEGTPDGSPGSSRGCSPYPDLYTGPHLLAAIENLDLSPNASPCMSPMPPKDRMALTPQSSKDGQAKDLNMLTVPGRRSSNTLRREGETQGSNISLDIPDNIFSKESMKKIQVAKSAQKQTIVKTESENPQVKKEINKIQKESTPAAHKAAAVPPKMSVVGKQSSKDALDQRRAPEPAARREQESHQRRAPEPTARREQESNPAVPGRAHMLQQEQTFTGTKDLEAQDFVRRPTRPPPKDVKSVTPPDITVIPSTPKPTEVPVPLSPTLTKIAHAAGKNTAPQPKDSKVNQDEPKDSCGKQSESKEAKLTAPKPPAEKAASPGQKPATPPAATFQNNSAEMQNEPLLTKNEGKKKPGWL